MDEKSVQLFEFLTLIVGFSITLGIAINAFFLKGIFSDLNDVKIQLMQIVTESQNKEFRLLNLEKNQKDLYDRIRLLEKEVIK